MSDGLAPGITLLRGVAPAASLLAWVDEVAVAAPLRNMRTPGGGTMSVAMTNAGTLGWLSDGRGYRYGALDPLTGAPWPPLPPMLVELAAKSAQAAGFRGFCPDACLINRYVPGSRMGAHRDEDEADFGQPIVSVSLGSPARFVFHGATRAGRLMEIELRDADVLVFGGPARRYYHSVKRFAGGAPDAHRLNLTLRRAA